MKRTAGLLLISCVLVLSGCMLFDFGPEVLYEETFSGETAGQWPETDSDETAIDIENGAYHVRFKLSDGWITKNRNIDQGPFDNFQLDADIAHITGETNLCGGGVLFRVADWDNFYFFMISPAGTYTIRKEVGGTVTTLVAWTNSDVINKGTATNHLTVQADGSTLVFLINGQQVEQLEDTSVTVGDIGIYARTYDGATNAHMSFDNIIVTKLE